MSAGGDRLELGAEAGRPSATTPGDRRGRERAIIDGAIELRHAPESALQGPGLYVGGARLDRDAVEELIAALGDWLDEVRPEWRQQR